MRDAGLADTEIASRHGISPAYVKSLRSKYKTEIARGRASPVERYLRETSEVRRWALRHVVEMGLVAPASGY
jgi:hypothetical protein